jgi:ubiquinone/menaquinone biosynthesis C-methylase UbiE
MQTENARPSFDERAKDWDEDPKKVWRSQLTADAILRTVKPASNTTAFEFGCGTGLLSFAMKDAFAQITLSDTSDGMLDVLRRKITAAGAGHMRALRLDLTADPLPAERYGIAYSVVTLHHIPDTDGVLHRLYELLQPGGTLCIADLDKEDGSFHGPDEKVHHGFDREVLTRQAEAAGFADVHFETVLDITKKVNGKDRAFPLFLMTAKKRLAT